jgi:hypothetical protein
MHVSCAFKNYLGISGVQGGKLSDLKKILTIVHMPTLKTFKDIHVFNGMAQYY